jgi:hypothetical protein
VNDGLGMFRLIDPILFVCREVNVKARMCEDGMRLVRKHIDSQSHILRARNSQAAELIPGKKLES